MNSRIIYLASILFSIAFFTFIDSVQAQDTITILFTSEQWIVPDGTSSRIEKHLGQESVYLDGHAYLKEASFQNGVIEVDIAPNTDRGFAGITFRDHGGGNYEEVYLRMHKSGLPDAVQYSPFYNGEANWQLYPQHQTSAEFKTTHWNHLKLVVNGAQLEVFLNGIAHPSMVVDNLRHDLEAGTLGIRALFGNHFANFRYTPQDIPNPVSAPTMETPAGMITKWQLSPAFRIGQTDMKTYPQTEEWVWETVSTEATGLLTISKFRKRANGGNFEANLEDVVWARLTIIADQKGPRKLFFDYSDRVQVYLNEQPVFAGNNAFRYKGLLFREDIAVQGNALFLDLKKGKNELLIAVAKRANGWGLIGKWEDATGLRVE